MIMTYNMSAGTFENMSENCTSENTAQDYSASELHYRNLELQLLDISSEVTSANNTLTPELAAIDSEAFLRAMKK